MLQERYPGYHPVIKMADIAMDESNDVQLRANMHKEVAKYVTPQLKAIEHSGPDGQQLQIGIVQFRDITASQSK